MPPPVPSRAVFVSYASQDAEAVRRLAGVLEAAGLEVWLDQAELHSGDRWDAKIRQQIQDCALFLPIISANTEARLEGYFRLEWRLADERTHRMAHGKAFLVPVCIDGTSNHHAHVPESFHDVQWTRLPAGAADAGFAGRVRALLDGDVARPAARREIAGGFAVRPPRRLLWPAVAGTIVAIAVLAFVLLRPFLSHPTAPPNSIAVLPFENQSPDPDNAFFTEGVHEDVLTQLSHLSALHVVSRASVLAYRNSLKSPQAIGRELGVAFLLQGSVRRVGAKVRVTGQLVSVLTNEQLWADAYDRELTDIFGIQAELAREIATHLQAVLTPAEKTRLETRPTESISAYDQYLLGRIAFEASFVGLTERRSNLENAVRCFEQAVQLDPNFAPAWTHLVEADGYMYFWQLDPSEARLVRLREAVDAANRLAPDDPETLVARGQYYYLGFRDWARARDFFDRAITLSPSDARPQMLRAAVARREGVWTETLTRLEEIHARDPRNWDTLDMLGDTRLRVRRFDDAMSASREMIAIKPDELRLRYEAAQLDLYARGSTRELEAFFAGLPTQVRDSPEVLRLRLDDAWVRGDAAGVVAAGEALLAQGPDSLDDSDRIYLGLARLQTGHEDQGREELADARTRLRGIVERLPGNFRAWQNLALASAFLRDESAADDAAQHVEKLVPLARDAYTGAETSLTRATVQAWSSHPESAVPLVASLLRVPAPPDVNVYHLRVGLEWAPVRDHTDFKALLADPAANAPLF